MSQKSNRGPAAVDPGARTVEASVLELLQRVVGRSENSNPRRTLVEGLCRFEGVKGAWLGRPDEGGRIVIDTVSHPNVKAYLDVAEIRVDDTPEGPGDVGRAWRSKRIACTEDWHCEFIDASWREVSALLSIRSSMAVPLCGRNGAREILVIYSDRPCWFSSAVWRQFLEHVASVLGFVLEEWDLRRRLEQLARLDPLTQLPNRRALEEHLERLLTNSRRKNRSFTVGIIDLDGFKLLNDRFGHGAGDQILVCVAGRLRSNVRNEDFVARLGGDEFIVVFEDLHQVNDLKDVLDRLHEALVAPMTLGNGTLIPLEASLGLALWQAQGAEINASGLLRRADLALYQAKRDKLTRTRWWRTYKEGMPALPTLKGQSSIIQPYGAAAARTLGSVQDLLAAVDESFARTFCADMSEQARLGHSCEALKPDDGERLVYQQRDRFAALRAPHLDEEDHRKAARCAGRAIASHGSGVEWITSTHEAYINKLLTIMPRHPMRLRHAFPIISGRLARNQREQLAGYGEIVDARTATVRQLINHLTRSQDSLQFTEWAVEELGGLDEVAAVCVTRYGPRDAVLATALRCSSEVERGLVEKVLGAEVLSVLKSSMLADSVKAENGSCSIGHCIDLATVNVLPSRVRNQFRQLGLRSAAVLAWPGGRVPVYLWWFSRWSGGFSSAEHRVFLQQIGQLMALGWEQLPDPGPFTVSQMRRCRDALQAGGLVMYYQPVINLKTGELVKVEALARLRDGDRLLTPDQFLPLFDDDELFTLYQLGLSQSLAEAQRWAANGQPLSVGLNIPPQGLGDPRYLEVTAATLTAMPLPKGKHLYLEMLETQALDLANAEPLIALFQPWLALGVHFAEDDLGTGHSSLLRLHRLPFEEVKIDQALVRAHTRRPDPATLRKILAFIAALTHLAHVLGLKVSVEGLESEALVEAAGALGADFGQGFGIAKPMPAEFVSTWVTTRDTIAKPRVAEDDEFGAVYQELHEAISQFGPHSPAHARAYQRLYDLHAKRVEHRLTLAEPDAAKEP